MSTGPDTLDRLAAQLRASEPDFPDADFVAAVMGRLPARRALPGWLRQGLPLGAALLGSGLAAMQFPWHSAAALLLLATADLPLTVVAGLGLASAVSLVALWCADLD